MLIGFTALRSARPIVSLKAETVKQIGDFSISAGPIPLFTNGFPITNTILTSWIVIVLLIVGAYLRNPQDEPDTVRPSELLRDGPGGAVQPGRRHRRREARQAFLPGDCDYLHLRRYRELVRAAAGRRDDWQRGADEEQLRRNPGQGHSLFQGQRRSDDPAGRSIVAAARAGEHRPGRGVERAGAREGGCAGSGDEGPEVGPVGGRAHPVLAERQHRPQCHPYAGHNVRDIRRVLGDQFAGLFPLPQ